MTNINFTSRINPVTTKEFSKIITSIDRNNFVDYPWTINQTVKGESLYTTGICDCTSLLLSNGNEAVLLHLSPQIENNHSKYILTQHLKNIINLGDKNLQAVIVGSKKIIKSEKLYNMIVEFVNSLGITSTKLKGTKSPTHIAYKTNTDEIFITNNTINKALSKGSTKKEALYKGFDNVVISPNDEIEL